MGFFKYTRNAAVADFEGHLIRVENAWKMLPPKSLATLSVDGVELDRDASFAFPTPNVAQLKAVNVSEKIRTIDVFFAGVFSIKISIVVNDGELIQKDELTRLDEMHVRHSDKS